MMRITLLVFLMTLDCAACFAENLALGRPYTFSHPPNYPYCTDPGDATDLTDGVRYNPGGTSLWTQLSTVGWASGAQCKSIEIDLGQICAIDGLTFETAADTRTQGTFPLAVMVFLSDDGQTYSYAGDLINEAIYQEQYIVHTFELNGLADQARFVRLLTVSGGYYVFVDEIEVLGSQSGGLMPQVRELTSGAVTQFAKDRIPLSRQNNSSLTLLGHAQSQLAEEINEHAVAVGLAQAALEGRRSEILARSVAETVDYRLGVPFTALDREICREIGAYLAATGRSGLLVMPADPWTPLLPFDWDALSAASAPAAMLQNEWGELAFNLTNPTAVPMALSVTVTGLQAGVISLAEVKFVEAYGFRLRADALMPLSGPLDIPAGMTKQLWLTIDSRDLEPGQYNGEINLSGGGVNATEPFAFAVAPIAMSEQPALNVVNFSYMHWPIAQADPEGVARDLREHYVNAQVVISPYLPNFQADAEGNFIAPMDFTPMDDYMALLPGTSLWILWTGFEFDHREMYPKEGEPRRTIVFTQWLEGVIAHMKAKGCGYENFAFMWMDEPNQEKMLEIVKPSSELLRQVDPQAQVYQHITSDNTEASLAAFDGLIDIWCPASDKLGWAFWQGKRTWFYDSASDKGRSPTGHFRYKLWTAFDEGCVGNGFWVYTDSADLWDDYAGTPTYSVVYDGPNGVISSKRWDAYRAGVEDYELCRMLSDAIAAAEAAGQGQTPMVIAARDSLEERVTGVLDNRDDPMVAEQAHQELLGHLANLSVVPSSVGITKIVIEDTTALEFQSDPGIVYRLEYNTDPVVTNWTEAGFWIFGDGGLRNAYDPAGFSTQKSYRITLSP
jgi:hypothetical protein